MTIGTASQEVGVGPFRADVVADRLDFTTVHPYPTYNPELVPDSLLSARMTHAAAFETALAAGAGRPVMLHEYGVSSAQFDPGTGRGVRPAAGLVELRPRGDRLPGLVLDRRRARRLPARPVRPTAPRDPVRSDRPSGRRCGRGALSSVRWRRSCRSWPTTSTGWPGTGRSAARRSPCPHEYVRALRPRRLSGSMTRLRVRTSRPSGPGRRSGIIGRSSGPGSTGSSWRPGRGRRSASRARRRTTPGRPSRWSSCRLR